MSDDQATRLPSGYRPRRAPQPPRIDEAELPDAEELAQARAQLARRLRPNKFICK